MPVVDVPQNAILPDRTNYDMAVERDPAFSTLVKASLENDNLIYNTARVFANTRHEADPNFDVFDYVSRAGMEGYASRYIGTENEIDAEAITTQINTEQENKATIAAGGWEGVAAGAAAGLLDPTLLIPIGGTAYKTYRTGGRILEGAAHTALATGLVATADELALQSMQETRTPGESAVNIATATFTGGVLGVIGGALSKKEVQAATAGVERNMDMHGPEYVDYDTSLSAAAVNQTTLKDQQIKDTVGFKAYREPVLDWLAKKDAPEWTKTVAAKFLRNADEVLAFQDPVARMNNSASKVTIDLNEKLNETVLTRNKNTNGVASEIPVENAIKAWNLPKVTFFEQLDKNFLAHRNAKSKVLTGAQDAVNSVADKIAGRSRQDGKLTYHEFGQAVLEASHNGDQHVVPEVAATAKSLRKEVFDAHFDEAKRVGLVDEDAYKAAKEKAYSPYMYDHVAIRNDRPGATAKIKQHLVNKRDAAAARVQDGLKKFDLKSGDIGELFKQEKAKLKDAKGETRAAQKKVDSTGKVIENKTLTIDQVQSRLDEATKTQERLYEKILNGRDRGEDNLSDLFYEFRSQTTRKKELYRQMMAREGEEDIATQKLARRQAMVDQLLDHEGELEKRVNDFEDTLKEMTLDQYKASFHDGDLDNVAYQIVDRILGTPAGRLSYDNKLEVAGANGIAAKRGALKQRKFDIPYELIKDYLVDDLHSVVEGYSRSMAPDIELFRKFGTLDPEKMLKDIQDDYARKMRGVNDPDVARKLTQMQSNDIRDFKGTWERIRGTYGHSGQDDYASAWNTAQRVAMNLNYLSALGGMTISAFTDIARPVMVHGITRVYGDGLKAMATNMKGFKAAAKEILETGTALDMVMSTRARAMAGFDEHVPFANRVEAITGRMAHNFTMATLMSPWNTYAKQFSGVVTQSRMMKAINGMAAGKDIGAKEIENLAANYIDKPMAARIAKQFDQFGKNDGGVIVPNARSWTDVGAQKAFRAGIRREVDKIIVTPGQDKPFWMSKSGWKLMGQFRSFSMASTQRTMLSALQQKDMAVLNGTAMTVALGAMVYIIKSAQAGIEPELTPQRLVVEGIDRGGLTGWLMDANNVTEKITRGRVGVHPLIGGPPLSRYASRTAAEAILGPTYGKVVNGLQVTGDAFAGEIKPADVSMIRRMMPYQNLIVIRSLFDEAEKNINDALPKSK